MIGLPSAILIVLSIGITVGGDGSYLRVLPKEQSGMTAITRNSSGYIVKMAGVLPEVLDWISQYYGIRYTLLRDVVMHTDDSVWGRGTMSYLTRKEADLVLVGNGYSLRHSPYADFSAILSEMPMRFLIPAPKEDNIRWAAIAEPFDAKVWIGIVVSLVLVGACLDGVIRLLEKWMGREGVRHLWNFKHTTDYILGVLLSQGCTCRKTNWTVRLLAGVWCLACFVITTAYSSVLVAFITSPAPIQPIINSAQDMVGRPDIKVVTDRGSSFEARFRTSTDPVELYFYKQISDDPTLRCNTTNKCLQRVRSGNAVYPNLLNEIQAIVNKDRRESGKCRYTMAREPLGVVNLCLFLAKNSPYTETFNRGIDRLWENGLLIKWEKENFPKAEVCLKVNGKSGAKTRLSLSNLSGAFTILIIGCTLAFLLFIGENVCKRQSSHFNAQI